MLNTYVSIDLETTGLHPKQDRIIEIGAVKVIEGRQEAVFETLVNPGRCLEQNIVELTHIQDKQLKQAPYIDEVLPGLLIFLEDLPLVGHSILFDFSFLKKAAVDHKLTFERQAVDTLKIARKYLADLEHRFSTPIAVCELGPCSRKFFGITIGSFKMSKMLFDNSWFRAHRYSSLF